MTLTKKKNPISIKTLQISFFQKGSELATYIFVDLPRDAPLPPPGSTVTIKGLETASPSLRFEGGREGEGGELNKGEWKESVGSLLFVAAKGAGTEAAAHSPAGSYLCHTERILSFRN